MNRKQFLTLLSLIPFFKKKYKPIPKEQWMGKIDPDVIVPEIIKGMGRTSEDKTVTWSPFDNSNKFN